MNLELLILDGPQAGRRLPVGMTPAIIGRNPAVDLPFPLDNFVSGRHVSFQAGERGVLLNDLRSTNGTFLNGERVTQALARVGDLIKIGSMTVQVVEQQPSAASVAPSTPAVWGTGPVPRPSDAAASTAFMPEDEPSTWPAHPLSPPALSPPAPAAQPAFSLPPMEIPAPPVPLSSDPFAAMVSPPAAKPAVAPALELPQFPAPGERSPLLDSGSTKILQSLNFSAPPPPSPSHKALADARQKNEAVLTTLRETYGPLFCLLHAGADETVPAMLALADVNLSEHCLLEADAAAPPPRWAPYLLPLTPEAPLLRLLVEKGWGKGWVSFFTSFAAFEELRGHFRKFLMVQVANGGEPYFRFYEPKVLREFLIAGSPAELTMFFGSVDEWFLEAESKAALLKARNTPDGLATTLVPLTDSAALPETLRAS